ncbi:hypothetical protein PQX77_001487 [Marasmius sp. AFHP31]|nr:hypothetical protein PQX77_001487 [Marasmius sp. AFHP31]
MVLNLLNHSARRLAGVWIALFIYDTILFFLTVSRTYHHWSRVRVDPHVVQLSLLSLMFRDGAMYFAVMALATLSNILTFYLCGPFMRGGLSSFASCISVTMMCRLMLNLHATADTGLSTRPGDPRRTDGTNSSGTHMDFARGFATTTTGVVFESVIMEDIPMTTFSSDPEVPAQTQGQTSR